MSAAPRVTGVVPTYGTGGRLRALLDELLRRDLAPGGLEIVVVDVGSPEPVEPRLAGLVTGPRGSSLRVTRTVNGGPARARNRGAREARAPILFFVDDDMELGPDHLREHLVVAAHVQRGWRRGLTVYAGESPLER